MHNTILGIDVAKNVFQLYGVDARGRAVLSRRVKRQQLLDSVANLPACVIGMEACGSAMRFVSIKRSNKPTCRPCIARDRTS
jgi:transposase